MKSVKKFKIFIFDLLTKILVKLDADNCNLIIIGNKNIHLSFLFLLLTGICAALHWKILWFEFLTFSLICFFHRLVINWQFVYAIKAKETHKISETHYKTTCNWAYASESKIISLAQSNIIIRRI